MSKPLAAIGGHQKAVSYVRFLGGDRLVSASTDNTLKLWDVNAASSGSDSQALMTYCGASHDFTRLLLLPNLLVLLEHRLRQKSFTFRGHPGVSCAETKL